MKFKINSHTWLIVLSSILIAASSLSPAQIKLVYTLSMSKPYTHYFEVETKVTGLKTQSPLFQFAAVLSCRPTQTP